MKKYVGNGYYFVDPIGRFSINKKATDKKKCLNNKNCVTDKEHLKQLFIETLKNDLYQNNVNCFFCATHDSFIDIIERAGFEAKVKIHAAKKAKIKELFKYWECNECEKCEHKESCFICNGCLPDVERNEYFLVFKRKNDE